MRNRSAQLKYPGGKGHCAETILAFAPSVFTEYRDPFCGNSPYLFYTDVIDTDIPRWINDMDPHVQNYLRTLRDDPNFISKFWALRDSIIDSAEAIRKEFIRACGKTLRKPDAVSYLLLRRLAHRQIVLPGQRKSVAAFGWSNIKKGLECMHLSDLYEARSILHNVKITGQDGFDVISAPTQGICFLTLDPPYRVSEDKSALYDYEFEDEDHQRLHDLLASLNPRTHKFLLTIDRTLPSYELWHDSEHRHSGLFRVFERPNRNGMSNTYTKKIEMLMRNFDS